MAAFDGVRDAAIVMKCEDVSLSATRLAHVLMVPVLQSVLHYAIKMKDLDAHSYSKDLAEGEVYASGIKIWCYLFRYRCRCRRINRFL